MVITVVFVRVTPVDESECYDPWHKSRLTTTPEETCRQFRLPTVELRFITCGTLRSGRHLVADLWVVISGDQYIRRRMKDIRDCCWNLRHSARSSSTFVEGKSVRRSVIVKC